MTDLCPRDAAWDDDLPQAGGSAAPYDEALRLFRQGLISLDRAEAPPARGGLSGWQRKRVADFIEAHLAQEVRLSALAALVELSPYHFARAFKRSFGLPPHRYHVRQRIERAKALLAEAERSVTEVALMLGFAETSSFSAAFRRHTGASPSRYRRERAASEPTLSGV